MLAQKKQDCLEEAKLFLIGFPDVVVSLQKERKTGKYFPTVCELLEQLTSQAAYLHNLSMLLFFSKSVDMFKR